MPRGGFRRGAGPPHRSRTDRYVSMLDMRRLNHFRYDAKQVFGDSGMDPAVWTPLLSSIVAKASRNSIRDAKDYIAEKEKEGVVPKETAEIIMRLLDRYKKWR